MLNVIRDGTVITDDPWVLIDKDAELDNFNTYSHVIVPLTLWQQHSDELSARKNVGIWLDSDQSAYQLTENLNQFTLIAINFPVFSDGRGYSYAEIIRREGFEGELRAIGDVLKDQLYFYKRVGFDTYVLREDLNAEESLTHLSDFAETYQVSHSHPTPLFKRR